MRLKSGIPLFNATQRLPKGCYLKVFIPEQYKKQYFIFLKAMPLKIKCLQITKVSKPKNKWNLNDFFSSKTQPQSKGFTWNKCEYYAFEIFYFHFMFFYCSDSYAFDTFPWQWPNGDTSFVARNVYFFSQI